MSLFRRTDNPTDSFWHRKLGPVFGSIAMFVIEVAQIMIISLAIILPIRYFLILPFYVKGASMEPTFLDHEYLIIDELTYRFNEPKRGDVIVFHNPNNYDEFFIKRVIGLPGEKVVIKNDKVYIYNTDFPNGDELKEDYLVDNPTAGDVSTQLGVDEYFVMGDNRKASFDSRYFGPIKMFGEDAQGHRYRNIVGRVWFRGLPISRLSLFPTPVYQY